LIHCYYRLNHPIESKKRKQQLGHGQANEGGTGDIAAVKDFEFARNELAQIQNAR